MKRKQQGFTLIEMMLVVTIIAILLGTAMYKFSPIVDWVKGTRVKGDIQAIRSSLLLYQSTNGFYPTTEQGLKALVVKPESDPMPEQWRPILDSVPRDPWGSEYIYRSPGQKNPTTFDLLSAGPDRIVDTADDDWGR